MQHDMGVGQILEELVQPCPQGLVQPALARQARHRGRDPARVVGNLLHQQPQPQRGLRHAQDAGQRHRHTPEGRVVVLTYSVISFR